MLYFRDVTFLRAVKLHLSEMLHLSDITFVRYYICQICYICQSEMVFKLVTYFTFVIDVIFKGSFTSVRDVTSYINNEINSLPT